MKVSSVKVSLTDNDVIAIIKEYVKVDGLKINEVYINNNITIIGSYKKGIELNFKLVFGIGNVYDNLINLKVFNFSVGKIGIPTVFRKIAIKKVVESFKDYGVSVKKDFIKVDLDKVIKYIPNIYFKLIGINVKSKVIEAEVDELIYSADKEVEKVQNRNKKSLYIKPIQDNYSKVRRKVENKIPEKYRKICEFAFLIPDIIVFLLRLLKDTRVSIKSKALIFGILAYLITPFDIFPDFIPFIGEIDDVSVAFFGLNLIFNDLPEEVILENWQGNCNIILKVREVINFISDIVGIKNVRNIIKSISFMNKKINRCNSHKLLQNKNKV